MEHEAIVNKQQSVLCQHDLSLHPTQLANGVVWEPCPGTEEALDRRLQGLKVSSQN